MDLRKCKSQLLASLLSLSLSISAIFLFAGCSKETAKTSPSASTEESMTRQAFYSLLYKEITQDELLRSIYFPETTQLDAAKILCNISGEREFSEESQAELVYNAKLKSVSNLRIATKTLKQNGCHYVIEMVAYHGQCHDSTEHPEKSAYSGTSLHIPPRKKGPPTRPEALSTIVLISSCRNRSRS